MDMTLAGVPKPLELLHASSLEALELNVPSSPRIWGQSPEAPGHSPLIATRAVQIQRGEYLLLQWFDDLESPFSNGFVFCAVYGKPSAVDHHLIMAHCAPMIGVQQIARIDLKAEHGP